MFDTITKYKHNYNYFGEKFDESTVIGSEEEEISKRIKFVYSPASFYILWVFLPMSYLEREKRQAKIICFLITLAIGFVEFGFLF